MLRLIPYDDNIVTFRMMEEGFTAAVERLLAGLKSREPDAAFAALFEALNWAVAIDDRIGAHWAPQGEPLGRKWRTNVPGAAPMAGIRFARNRVHHQWGDALLLVEEEGLSLPLRFPVQSFEWRWRPANQLPEGRSKEGQGVYCSALADRGVHHALVELQDAFKWVAERLEPPRPAVRGE